MAAPRQDHNTPTIPYRPCCHRGWRLGDQPRDLNFRQPDDAIAIDCRSVARILRNYHAVWYSDSRAFRVEAIARTAQSPPDIDHREVASLEQDDFTLTHFVIAPAQFERIDNGSRRIPFPTPRQHARPFAALSHRQPSLQVPPRNFITAPHTNIFISFFLPSAICRRIQLKQQNNSRSFEVYTVSTLSTSTRGESPHHQLRK